MNKMVYDLIRNGYLRSDAIIAAFAKVSRVEFVPKDLEKEADKNIPLPIGFGQTISQPLTVAFMFELLDPQAGQHILDVGSGSGWTTALLAQIVGERGMVCAIERIPQLCEFAEKNLAKFSFLKKGIVKFYCRDGSKGLAENAPYDRILVSAAADEVPAAFKKQLKIGGKMVIPVRNKIWYLEKKSAEDFYQEEYAGFAFVPLIEENNI